MPLNIRCWDLIVEHADLFDTPNVPEYFLQLVAHVSAYKVHSSHNFIIQYLTVSRLY
jgi:hypothetical protein